MSGAGAGTPPVLLLIDFQEAFREIAATLPRNEPGAEDRAALLLADWRERGLPVIHVRHDSVEPGSRFRPGADGHPFQPFARPLPGEAVVAKSVNSAFIGTDLQARLDALGQPPLVVCGATTDHCVSTTVRMAGNLGFAVTLAADACFTFDRVAPGGAVIPAAALHAAHLASLDGEFARVRTTESILSALSSACLLTL